MGGLDGVAMGVARPYGGWKDVVAMEWWDRGDHGWGVAMGRMGVATGLLGEGGRGMAVGWLDWSDRGCRVAAGWMRVARGWAGVAGWSGPGVLPGPR